MGIFRSHHVEQEIREVVGRTKLTRKAVKLGIDLAMELAACTTYSPRSTWCLVRRFLEVFVAGYRMRVAMGIDPTTDLIDMAIKDRGVDPPDRKPA
jgi:hypothetical protein